jgi:Rrf2 family iron-sulfur cluster assembly transcriptional regulator
MWISGTTQYAIRAVLFVAEHGADEPVRVDSIAAALQVPRNYLSKTLHALARAGVLKSGRGPRGGFQLAFPPAQLSLARVAEPFDDLAARRCLLGRTNCGWKNPCSVHPRWEAVSNQLQSFFRETTIADLLGAIAERPSMAPIRDRGALPLRPDGPARKDPAASVPRSRARRGST